LQVLAELSTLVKDADVRAAFPTSEIDFANPCHIFPVIIPAHRLFPS
jgi:hypothetical protein